MMKVSGFSVLCCKKRVDNLYFLFTASTEVRAKPLLCYIQVCLLTVIDLSQRFTSSPILKESALSALFLCGLTYLSAVVLNQEEEEEPYSPMNNYCTCSLCLLPLHLLSTMALNSSIRKTCECENCLVIYLLTVERKRDH